MSNEVHRCISKYFCHIVWAMSVRICCFWSKYFAHVKRIIYLDYIYYENMLKVLVFFFFFPFFQIHAVESICHPVNICLHSPHHFSTSMLLYWYWSGIQVFTSAIFSIAQYLQSFEADWPNLKPKCLVW